MPNRRHFARGMPEARKDDMERGKLDVQELLNTALIKAYGPMSATRKWASEKDTYETRSARRLVRALRSGRPDVLFLGDSTSYAFHVDGDLRPVPTMLRRLLKSQSVFSMGNAGYFADIHDAYLGLVEQSDVRPIVITPLATRMHIHNWRFHPAYTYAQEIAAIRALSLADPHVPKLPKSKPPAEAFTEFRAMPCRTVLGEFPVGYYIKQVQREDLPQEERSRWWYAYLHGSEIVDGPHLDLLRKEGQTLARLGCPVVAYQSPIDVATGTRLLGEEWARVVQHNLDLVEQTLLDSVGPKATVLRTGTAFATYEFNNPADAIEHLRGPGRRRLAHMLADAVRTAQ
jgi:hypothetical protein